MPPNTCPSCRKTGVRRKIVHDLNIGKLGVRRAITLYNLIIHKWRYLNKHKREVDCYYRKIAKFDVKSDIVAKYRARFEKSRAKLVTFLDYDGVPWNNNNAEHAVKAFARIRHVLRGSSTDKGLRDYLVLLSICETCKARGINFLEFLRSRESDIDVFSAHGEKRIHPVSSRAAKSHAHRRFA